MQSRGNTLRLTAVATLVVLALTGFSTGRGHGGGSGGDGGGCSSSSQNQGSSSTSGGGSHHDDDDDDSYDYDDAGGGGTGGSTGSSGSVSASLQDATTELLSCASDKARYATVRVTNPNTVDGVFLVTVAFEDPTGDTLSTRSQQVAVIADGTVTTRVEVGGSGKRASRISVCDLDRYAPAAR
ncbi:hypothetical protein ACIF80_10325 [Streptomyces sp. NPDC085927]|uniref:hypothetical protein n=1 Tax=Streptomyces sp. NPDC085927 TaxID=3365738 RepID=UPI0037D5A3F7